MNRLSLDTVRSVRIRVAEAADAVGGHLIGVDRSVELIVEGASFDSRSIGAGQLFVPLVAQRDGHDFIDAAIAGGAGAYLTAERDVPERGVAAIQVADTASALMALAAWARRRLDGRVVGVTGSVGKTTTKDLIAAACGVSYRTTANERSFNNEQGLPITILNAPDDTEVLVLEMGMRGLGHIARLCEVARPDIGVITVVGDAHTELTGGIDGVARAKAELVEALDESGVAVLNADDRRVAAMAASTAARVLTYGVRGDVRVRDVVLDAGARAHFSVDTPWGTRAVALGVPGAHMVANAAAAIAVAGVIGVDIGAAAAALQTATVSGMRMEEIRPVGGGVVINDAYNANPTSMRAALDALVAIDAVRHVAVVGVMAELDDPAAAHLAIAEYARDRGIELVAVGTDAYGVEPVPVEALVARVRPGPGTAILVKASRAGALERAVEPLVNARAASGE